MEAENEDVWEAELTLRLNQGRARYLEEMQVGVVVLVGGGEG